MTTKIWQLGSVFVIVFLFSTAAFAQVKEVNALGKKWYLHGIDFRAKGIAKPAGYYDPIVSNANFNNPDYLNLYDTLDFTFHRTSINPITEVSIGAVFRPLHRSKFHFFRQTEIAHNFSYQRSSNFFDSYPSYNDFAIRTNHIGYNPRIMVSSPRFLESLKLYIAADGYLYLPLANMLYTRPPQEYLPNGGGSYRTGEKHFWTDRLASNFTQYGTGLSIGIKINVDCNWNFHLEGNAATINSYFGKNALNVSNRILGIQFGARYKFGTDEEGQQGNKSGNVFW